MKTQAGSTQRPCTTSSSSSSSSSSPSALFAISHRPDQDFESIALSPSLLHRKCCSVTTSDHAPRASSSAAFHDGHTAAAAYHEAASLDRDDGSSRMAAQSPCWWLRSTAQELPLPEIRYKCRSLIARIRWCRWRQGHIVGSEFGYNPMSYALNFEDDRESDEEFPARNFSARMPVSPDRLRPANLTVSEFTVRKRMPTELA